MCPLACRAAQGLHLSLERRLIKKNDLVPVSVARVFNRYCAFRKSLFGAAQASNEIFAGSSQQDAQEFLQAA